MPPAGLSRGSRRRSRVGRSGRRARLSSGRCAIRSIVRSACSRCTALETIATLNGSRSAVGSSRITRGASLRNARASPDPPPLARGKWAGAVADDRVVAVRQRADELIGAGERGCVADLPVRRVRIGEPDVLFDRAAEQRRMLWDPRELAPPGGPVADRQVDAADADAAGRRLEQTEQQSGDRALARLRSRRPAPRSPRGRARDRVVEHECRACWVGERHRIELDRGQSPGSGPLARPPGEVAGGASSSANICSATARPSALAWYSAPSRRNGRYSSGARISTVSPASSPRLPATMRRPASTATRATPSVAASSSTDAGQEADAERLHRGRCDTAR